MRRAVLVPFLLCAAWAAAQQHVFRGVFLNVPPVVDGVIGEAEWANVPSQTGGYDEQTGQETPYECRYWLAYDRTYIYFAAKLLDPNPGQIHATEFRSNVSLDGDDSMQFDIDPFNTLSDHNEFQVNPRGATNIVIAGGRAAKQEWLGEFKAKARIVKDGWEVEGRVPWAIMRLPAPGLRNLRVTFGRVIQRSGRVYMLDNVSGNKSTNIGIWSQVDVPRVAMNRTLKLLPYTYGGADRGGLIANAGLDMKAPITGDLDFVGSINPDFRNIENQVLSIDFSYFERLAGESRPFFLEGSDYFRTSLDAPLFVSQRISGFDTGAKVYGKLSENSTMALLDTVDFSRRNDLVGAYRYHFSPNTDAGFAMTDLESPGLSNRGTFLSLNHQFAPFGLFVQHMETTDSSVGDGHRYNAGVTFERGGWFNDLEYLEISPKFLPRLGFAPETDLRGFTDSLGFDHPVGWGSISEVGANFGFEGLRTFEHTNYRQSGSGFGMIALRDGTEFDFGSSVRDFGGFRDRTYSLAITRPRNDPYRSVGIDIVGGRVAGESYRSILGSLAVRPWRHFQVAASHQRVDHGGVAEQSILSLNYDMNGSDSVSGRAIRFDGSTNFYLAWRRTGNRGNEYYVILGDPNAPTFRTSLVVKAVFPFELKF